MVGGQESDLLGVLLISLGMVVALAVWFKLAGPVGRGISDLFGWLFGLGRYPVPIALALGGVALIRKQRFEQRFRVGVAISGLAVAILGLLHIAKGPAHLTSSLKDLKAGGGWFGALIGTPLRSALAGPGAVVILLALGLGAMLVLTRTSLRTAAGLVRRGAGGVARPLGQAARKAIGEVSTLSSDRDPTPARPLASGHRPTLYDAAADDFPMPQMPRPSIPGEPAPSKRTSRFNSPWAPPKHDDAAELNSGELALGPGARPGIWKLPPLSYLDRSSNQVIDTAEATARGLELVNALNSHAVRRPDEDRKITGAENGKPAGKGSEQQKPTMVSLVGMTVGPTVTRYELELADGVKVASVISLQRDMAYAMAAVDVRILAPIPGKKAIGVEVPNHTRQLVALGDLMASAEAKNAVHPLEVAVGKDIAGRSVFLNLSTTPHLLIAGATGAGKSSGINCIITSLLMRTTPDQVRLILIDPKQVEMGQYNKLPHLLTQPVTNPKKAANALGWAVREMERRYDLLSEVGFRDITGYNASYDRGELSTDPVSGEPTEYVRLAYIVVVVDELNDLMMVAARDVEESITRIAQKARAVGIHLIVATQRPSVNVITGVIKANVPARMAFAVSSLTDSRVILDQPGAEKLVGKGDMLLLPGNSSVAQRIQGSFVSEEEVRKVVAFWRRQAPEVTYVSNIEGDDGASGSTSGGYATSSGGDDDDDENLLRQAMELVVRSQLGSTSMLQRKLKVGFARAGRIMDLLEQRGVVGPSEGSKARSVLMTVEEYELIQQDGRDPG